MIDDIFIVLIVVIVLGLLLFSLLCVLWLVRFVWRELRRG